MSESYKGIKFKVVMKDKVPIEDHRLEELRYWCKIFHEKKLAPPYPGGSYGNLSFRERAGENGFIITGTCIGLKDRLDNSCFVRVSGCDLKEKIIYAEGCRNPSSESMLHYAIYNSRPDVQAVFHGHAEEFLNSRFSNKFPVTANEEPYGSIELVNSVLEILGNENFFIIKNHGFISAGISMKEAGERCLALLDNFYNSF